MGTTNDDGKKTIVISADMREKLAARLTKDAILKTSEKKDRFSEEKEVFKPKALSEQEENARRKLVQNMDFENLSIVKKQEQKIEVVNQEIKEEVEPNEGQKQTFKQSKKEPKKKVVLEIKQNEDDTSGKIVLTEQTFTGYEKHKPKETKRDDAWLKEQQERYHYAEFTNEDEIKEFEKGKQLREKVEAQRKAIEQKIGTVEYYIQSSSSQAEEKANEFRKRRFKSRNYHDSNKKIEQEQQFIKREINIFGNIIVSEVAHEMSMRAEDVIKVLHSLGLNVKKDSKIDADIAELLVEECGHTPRRIKKLTLDEKAKASISREDYERIPPVVTIMGHVDHGKTSLLDAIRKSDVANAENGGITQHIGAYQITTKTGKKITFIDTPGHEAFTQMRARGASVTHIVVLVVAADDGIMPQTIEAISHAKSANVPIILAINKIDKPNTNITKLKQELLFHNVILEEFSGDVMAVEVSAKTGQGLEKLEEAILLQAEVLDIQTSLKGHASGIVIESQLDKQKGIIANAIVQSGTVKTRDIIVCGTSFGKIRAILDHNATELKFATPSTPIEIYGFSSVPLAGDKFYIVENEKVARDIVENRLHKQREANKTGLSGLKTNTLAAMLAKTQSVDKSPSINLIIRSDVQGTLDAINQSLQKIKHEEVQLEVIQSSVGSITDADILLAKTQEAMICAFNIKVSPAILSSCQKHGVKILEYGIIYKLVEDIEAMVKGKATPVRIETKIGEAEVRAVFNITKSGTIAGCIIRSGLARRNAVAKLYRSGKEIISTTIKTLKHFKENVKELQNGNECGIELENFENIQVGDNIVIFEVTIKSV